MKETAKSTIESVIAEYTRFTGLSAFFVPADAFAGDGLGAPVISGCAFCAQLQSEESGRLLCLREQLAASLRAAADGQCCDFSCHAGLIEWVAPVYEQETLTGYLFSGFVCADSRRLAGMREELTLYSRRYGLTSESLLTAIEDTPVVMRDRIDLNMQLLSSLLKTAGYARADGPKEIRSSVRDVIGFLEDEQRLDELPTEHPLSHYIDSSEEGGDYLTIFWKTVEIEAGDIFNCVMSGRNMEGCEKYSKLLELAYRETDLISMKTSAEILFQIIFMKYYSKDLFDTRFYKLASDTGKLLIGAADAAEIREIMERAYRTMFSFYNEKGARVSTNSISRAVIRYLEQNYSRDLHLEDVARQFYLSGAYVNRLFKEQTGHTIKQCLLNIRMSHAQKLLLDTSLSVTEISRRVGYQNNLRGFYKIFQNHFGMTCTEMRKKYRSF